MADLHTHTTASDGMNSPSMNVQLAKEAGLAAIAITDHDTVSGVEEAMKEGERIGIRVVPGIEISTVACGQDIHVLGYFIDITDEVLLSRLAEIRDTRQLRNTMMIEKLQQLGMDITLEEVTELVSDIKQDGDTIGRPHIAQLLVKKGYVASVNEAFERLLGTGGAAYVNPPRISPQTAINWIHEAKGAAVLAHPGLYKNDELVIEIIGQGVDGIEVYHSDHSPRDEARYQQIAAQHNLIVTAGSDFHGAREGEMFHGEVGARRISITVLDQLIGI
ncbi:PHP domain-containing protein [Paenibacillus albiflavus]|nr:PHP domain-containing protein [Paenibacillus albiflavus]